MNASKYISIVIALSFIIAFPYKAFSHKQIPFYACYACDENPPPSGPDLKLQCDGPWSRKGVSLIEPGESLYGFYYAEVTKFSPYGEWKCHICMTNGRSLDCSGPKIAEAKFHLNKDDDEVKLTVTKDSLTANLSEEGDTITAAATLGDDNTKPKRDRDTFTFNFGPNPGDRLVTVTLEEDPEAGHGGEQATLILRNGSRTIESKTDALPIEISATLPSDGEYKLVVQQNGIPEDVRFRGNYYLSVKSDSGDIQEIKPSDDVEQ